MYDRDYSLYLAEYEKYWMHSGEVVNVKTEDSEIKGVSVAGVDKFGYLKLLKEDGATLTVPPEGYSYNICDKIVKPKPWYDLRLSLRFNQHAWFIFSTYSGALLIQI